MDRPAADRRDGLSLRAGAGTPLSVRHWANAPWPGADSVSVGAVWALLEVDVVAVPVCSAGAVLDEQATTRRRARRQRRPWRRFELLSGSRFSSGLGGSASATVWALSGRCLSAPYALAMEPGPWPRRSYCWRRVVGCAMIWPAPVRRPVLA